MIASFNPHLNLMMETLLFAPSDGRDDHTRRFPGVTEITQSGVAKGQKSWAVEGGGLTPEPHP